MKVPSGASLVAALIRSVPWLALLVLGVVLQAVELTQNLPKDIDGLVFSLGSVAALVGGAGVGGQFGRELADENLRLKLEPAFRRTMRIYRGLQGISQELDHRRVWLEEQQRANLTIPAHAVAASLDVLAARLEEQLLTLDDAVDEWRELNPEAVGKLEAAVEQHD